MKRLAVLPLCLTLAAGPVWAGSAGEPIMEPEVIVADASSSSGATLGMAVGLLVAVVVTFVD